MRTAFIETLTEEARINERIFLITADMGFSVFERFQRQFPDRFLNVGISEQNAIGVAAGLALSGYLPIVYSIIPFITFRCLEQIRVDVAYMRLDVRIVGVGAGLDYGSAGSSHHAIEDIAVMRSMPQMTVCCPGDPLEVKILFKESLSKPGPFYFRLGRGGEPVVHKAGDEIRIGTASVLREGEDIAILATSNTLALAARWTEMLESQQKSVCLVSMHTLKPIDDGFVRRLIERRIPIVTVEEHSRIGGLGSAIAEIIAESGDAARFFRMGLNDEFIHQVGSQRFLRDNLGLSYAELNSALEELK